MFWLLFLSTYIPATGSKREETQWDDFMTVKSNDYNIVTVWLVKLTLPPEMSKNKTLKAGN